MSRGSPKLELKLNLSPPRTADPRVVSPSRSVTVSPTSTLSSCLSSEFNLNECGGYPRSPEATTSMKLVGCQRCLMYVMLSEDEQPKCPRCKSTVLLDFLRDNNQCHAKSRKS